MPTVLRRSPTNTWRTILKLQRGQNLVCHYQFSRKKLHVRRKMYENVDYAYNNNNNNTHSETIANDYWQDIVHFVCIVSHGMVKSSSAMHYCIIILLLCPVRVCVTCLREHISLIKGGHRSVTSLLTKLLF